MGKPDHHRARVGLRGLATFVAFAALAPVDMASAGEAKVRNVEIEPLGGERYRISVTVGHADTGWDHYANAWIVVGEAGRTLAERVLHHPHVDEQPFTRSITATLAADVKRVRVRAIDSVHGMGAASDWVAVPGR